MYIQRNLSTFGGKQEEKDEERKKIKEPVRNEQTMSGRARVNGGDAAVEIYGDSYLIVHTKAIMG